MQAMLLNAALSALSFAIQNMPIQAILTNMVNSFISTSPLVNPSAPASVTEAHPSAVIEYAQAWLNSQDTTLPPLKTDGLYGPKTEAKALVVAKAKGLTIPLISSAVKVGTAA